MSTADVIAALTEKRARDARWQDGRTFGMVYDGGPEVQRGRAKPSAAMFLHENALNTARVPEPGRDPVRGRRCVSRTCSTARTGRGRVHDVGRHREHPHGGEGRARARPRRTRRRPRPRWSSPTSAHAAFHKAAHYFGVARAQGAGARRLPRRRRRDGRARERQHRARRRLRAAVPAGCDRPDPGARRASRPSVGASMHVDACMGGFVLPFMEMNGETVPPWDFRVDGVTTISADIHKLGYAPKGASVLVHRTKELRALPDVRVRRLARRVLRVARHAGHAGRACRWRRRGRSCTTSASTATGA